MKNSVLFHVDNATVVHMLLSDPEAIRDLEAKSLYVERITPSHVVAYGKSDDFFDALASIEESKRGEIRTFVSNLNAVISL